MSYSALEWGGRSLDVVDLPFLLFKCSAIEICRDRSFRFEQIVSVKQATCGEVWIVTVHVWWSVSLLLYTCGGVWIVPVHVWWSVDCYCTLVVKCGLLLYTCGEVWIVTVHVWWSVDCSCTRVVECGLLLYTCGGVWIVTVHV